MASEVEQLRQEIQAELAQLQVKLATYESAQKEAQEAVASQVAAATLGLQELYAKASGAIGELKARVEKVEDSREMGKDGKNKILDSNQRPGSRQVDQARRVEDLEIRCGRLLLRRIRRNVGHARTSQERRNRDRGGVAHPGGRKVVAKG